MQKSTIDDILERLKILEAELETEIDQLLSEKRELFRYTLDKGKVRFEQGIYCYCSTIPDPHKRINHFI